MSRWRRRLRGWWAGVKARHIIAPAPPPIEVVVMGDQAWTKEALRVWAHYMMFPKSVKEQRWN